MPPHSLGAVEDVDGLAVGLAEARRHRAGSGAPAEITSRSRLGQRGGRDIFSRPWRYAGTVGKTVAPSSSRGRQRRKGPPLGRQHERRAADEGREGEDREAVGVRHRDRGQEAVLGAQAHGRASAASSASRASASHRDAARRAGRARGQLDDGHVAQRPQRSRLDRSRTRESRRPTRPADRRTRGRRRAEGARAPVGGPRAGASVVEEQRGVAGAAQREEAGQEGRPVGGREADEARGSIGAAVSRAAAAARARRSRRRSRAAPARRPRHRSPRRATSRANASTMQSIARRRRALPAVRIRHRAYSIHGRLDHRDDDRGLGLRRRGRRRRSGWLVRRQRARAPRSPRARARARALPALPHRRVAAALDQRGLAEIGAERRVAARRLRPEVGRELHSPDGRPTSHADFAQAWEVPTPQTYQVPRAQFDQVLLEHAAACGARVLQGRRADGRPSTPTASRSLTPASEASTADGARRRRRRRLGPRGLPGQALRRAAHGSRAAEHRRAPPVRGRPARRGTARRRHPHGDPPRPRLVLVHPHLRDRDQRRRRDAAQRLRRVQRRGQAHAEETLDHFLRRDAGRRAAGRGRARRDRRRASTRTTPTCTATTPAIAVCWSATPARSSTRSSRPACCWPCSPGIEAAEVLSEGLRAAISAAPASRRYERRAGPPLPSLPALRGRLLRPGLPRSLLQSARPGSGSTRPSCRCSPATGGPRSGPGCAFACSSPWSRSSGAFRCWRRRPVEQLAPAAEPVGER